MLKEYWIDVCGERWPVKATPGDSESFYVVCRSFLLGWYHTPLSLCQEYDTGRYLLKSENFVVMETTTPNVVLALIPQSREHSYNEWMEVPIGRAKTWVNILGSLLDNKHFLLDFPTELVDPQELLEKQNMAHRAIL